MFLQMVVVNCHVKLYVLVVRPTRFKLYKTTLYSLIPTKKRSHLSSIVSSGWSTTFNWILSWSVQKCFGLWTSVRSTSNDVETSSQQILTVFQCSDSCGGCKERTTMMLSCGHKWNTSKKRAKRQIVEYRFLPSLRNQIGNWKWQNRTAKVYGTVEKCCCTDVRSQSVDFLSSTRSHCLRTTVRKKNDMRRQMCAKRKAKFSRFLLNMILSVAIVLNSNLNMLAHALLLVLVH